MHIQDPRVLWAGSGGYCAEASINDAIKVPTPKAKKRKPKLTDTAKLIRKFQPGVILRGGAPDRWRVIVGESSSGYVLHYIVNKKKDGTLAVRSDYYHRTKEEQVSPNSCEATSLITWMGGVKKARFETRSKILALVRNALHRGYGKYPVPPQYLTKVPEHV